MTNHFRNAFNKEKTIMNIRDEIKQKRTEMIRNEVGDVNPIIQKLFAYMDKTFKKRFIPK